MKMWKQFLRMNSRQNVLNEHLGETGNDLNLMVELIRNPSRKGIL